MSPSSRERKSREKQLVRYFRRLPVRPSYQESTRIMAGGLLLALLSILLVGGSPSVCSGTLASTALLAGAVALLVKGGMQRLRQKYAYEKALVSVFPQPSDSEVDRWLDEEMQDLRRYSLEKLDLTEEECSATEPLLIQGPVLWYTEGVAPEDLVSKTGQDGVPRFGVYQISYLWLADDLLGTFRCDYDFIRDAVLNEETHQFFYRDIISVSTQEKASALTLPTGQSLTSVREFRIHVANDRSFTVTVNPGQLKELTGAERVPNDGSESAIRALRAKLKEKKAPLLAG